MGLRNIDIIAALLLNLIQYGHSDHILPCNSSVLLGVCSGDHEVCNVSQNACVCLDGFHRVGDKCIAPEDEPQSHSDVTVPVVTIVTLALLIVGAVLVVRKYNLLDYVRQRLFRRNTEIMYEDVMIGNDDPPLSP